MPDLTTPANMVRELPIDKMGLSYDGVDLGGFPCIRSMEAPRVTT